MWELAYQLPQWIFMVLEIEPAYISAFARRALALSSPSPKQPKGG